jgi:hypothetical protein
VRQRKLLEQANSSIANNNFENKATANFKGFNTDRNSSATEAVNNLRPDYSTYKTSIQLKQDEADSIKLTTEFLQFEGIIAQAIALENNADKKAKEYESTKLQGEEKVIESQTLIDLAAEEKKKSKKQALAEEAIRVDNEGRDLLNKADTIKIQAQNEMLKAAAVKAEADKFITKLNKTQQDKIIAVYQNQIIVDAVEIASKADESNNKEEITSDPKINKKEEIVVAQEQSKENKEATKENKKEPENNNLASNSTTKENNKEPEVNGISANSSVIESKSQPKSVTQTKDKESVLNEIKATPEYNEYAVIKDEAEKLKQSASVIRAEADSVKVQAQRDAINSNDLFEFAAAQPKKKDRKEAQKKAEDMDRVSKENEAKADSLGTLAENAESASRMKQYEADNYLKKFDDTKSKTLLMAYNNTVPDELLKVETTPVASTKNVAINNKTSENQNKPVIENNEKNSVAANNSKTNNEQAGNNSVKQDNQVKPSTPIVQNNAKQPNNNQTSQEENVVPNETTAPVIKVKPPKPDVKTTPEYNQFVSLNKEAELAATEAAAWKQRIDTTKALSNQKLDESNNKLEEAASLKKKQRKVLVKEAVQLDYESQILAREADSLSVFANESNKNARDKKAAAEAYLTTIDKDLALRIMRSIEGIPEPIEVETSVAVQETQSQNENQRTESNFISSIDIKNGKPHGSGNPIRMNEPLRDGLVFKVQIGAFNKPVADNAFGTVSPVSGETIPNSNLIRYTAGLFTAFEEASKARKELNGLNYKDAFIVAYCYGKRISVTEARTLMAAGKDCKTGGSIQVSQNALANNTNNKTAADNNPTASNNTIANANINPPAQIKAGETLPQQDIQVIKGLLYTVQVGVYSKPVKAGQLYNITPLYYELNQKGQYRYTSGIFNEVKEAVKAKDVIVQIGVSDAFVSAYINGKRIPMEQAAALEAQQGKTVFAQVQGMNVQPKTIPQAGSAEQRNIVTNEPKVNIPSSSNNVAANIVYKVQLGAFRKDVPVEIMNKYLSIADKGIANFKTGDLTIYTVGNYTDIAAAENVKSEVIAKGITDAFIIAFNNGEKISLEEAKKLSGK